MNIIIIMEKQIRCIFSLKPRRKYYFDFRPPDAFRKPFENPPDVWLHVLKNVWGREVPTGVEIKEGKVDALSPNFSCSL